MNPADFRDPPKQFRPAPFWSWNDRLSPEELAWQVRDMKEKGFGGYFMHSRIGLATEYLSDAWMDAIRACLEEGERSDMESWLYDEDRWPSGPAGGLVTKRNPALAATQLLVERLLPENLPAAVRDAHTAAIYSVTLDSDRRIVEAEPVYPIGRGAEGPTANLYLFKIVRAAGSPQHNGEPYVDLLNPAATDAFLDINYKVYHDCFAGHFGEFMPGIFTDEPNYFGRGGLPWTPAMAERFEEANGYSLIESLPLLFFDSSDMAEACRVRYDFWKTVTLLFRDSFTRRLYDWCEKHNLQLTGHFLSEDTLLGQLGVIGAAMPHYEFMQVPGIDHLRRDIRNPLTLKQVSSAAHQLGHNRILCEIFGCSGHSMSFEDQKWIADFHFALGITFIDQHLTLYSMKGERKRDFPPTISYHQPYWPCYRYVNDYFARCSYALSQGRHCADILLLHPIASAWATYVAPTTEDQPPNPEAERYNEEFTDLVENLLAIHRDFDLGDETLLSRHGTVEEDPSTMLRVGGAAYSLVIMPPSLVWSSDTVALLSDFVEAGGELLAVGERPSLVDGLPGGQLAELFRNKAVCACENDREALQRTLDMKLEWDVTVTDEEGDEIGDIYYHHRRIGDRHVFFFSNKSRERTYRAQISLRDVGRLAEWRLDDGSVSEQPAEDVDGRLEFEAVFPPAGSRLFVVEGGSQPTKTKTLDRAEAKRVSLNGPWEFHRTHPNSITLDYAQLAVDGSGYDPPVPVWRIRRVLKQRFGLEAYERWQPWSLIKRGVTVENPAPVRLRYEFEVEVAPPELHLVVEQAERWRLSVNGQYVPVEVDGWHWDKQFGKVRVTDFVRPGLNHFELECTYAVDTEIEDVYLIGDFAVTNENNQRFTITQEPGHLNVGDWVNQGYPFYAGNMVYSTAFHCGRACEPNAGTASSQLPVAALAGGSHVKVRLNDPKGSLFRVSVNGSEPRDLAWQPWEVDVTDLVRDGENRVQIEVCGTLRNTMGPLHQTETISPGWTGPGDFQDEAHWTDEYQFEPYGLLGGAAVIIYE